MGDRCLYIETKSKVKRYVLGKNAKPLVLVQKRMFRCDDDLMIVSKTGGDEFVSYRIDSTQPRGMGTFVDTKITMAYIRIARSTNTKDSVGIIGTLNSIDSKIWIYLLVGGVIVYSLLGGSIV